MAQNESIAADPGSLLAAHLNGLLGAFWLLGVAWTLPRCRLPETATLGLVWTTIEAAYANWGITTLKAAWGVKGLAYLGEGKNDAILSLLLLLVVLPTLASAILWVIGLRPGGRAEVDAAAGTEPSA